MTCKGKNCTSDGKTPHSSECRFEYAANVASGVKGFTMPSRTTDHIATLEAVRSAFEGIPAPCEEREALDAAIALMRGQSDMVEFVAAVKSVRSSLARNRQFGDDTFGSWRRAACSAEGDLEEAIAALPAKAEGHSR